MSPGRDADVRVWCARPPHHHLVRVAARVEEPTAGQRSLPSTRHGNTGTPAAARLPRREAPGFGERSTRMSAARTSDASGITAPPCQTWRRRSTRTIGLPPRAAVREVRGLGVSRSRPGGVPSPTLGRIRAGRGSPARSSAPARRWPAPPGRALLPSTRAAQVETYGSCPAVSMPCAAPIISATDSASTSRMPRCCRASSSSGSCISNVRQLVREGLDLRGGVHVLRTATHCAPRSRSCRSRRDHPLVRHPQHLEPAPRICPASPSHSPAVLRLPAASAGGTGSGSPSVWEVSHT